jgi:CRISPR/Cas system CSM-associated protein Csm2 small subunit
MGDKKNKGLAIASIVRKMNGKEGDYESLKAENADTMKHVPNKDGAEQDSSSGLSACVDKMMESFDSKDKESFKAALRSFIEMVVEND